MYDMNELTHKYHIWNIASLAACSLNVQAVFLNSYVRIAEGDAQISSKVSN